MRKNKIGSIAVLTAVIMLVSACGGVATNTEKQPADSESAVSDDSLAVDNSILVDPYVPTLPSGEEQSSIFVQKIDGISSDYIRGMDVSSLLAEEASGVKYYDAAGNETDLMKILADSGVNCIRVRVWNDPFDSDGHGYGGGNCNAETAAILGARAATYSMDTCVDFHYSDFWADPNKQMCPKAWDGMNLTEKKEALYTYTVDSLKQIIDAGANVSLVQIGNEINNGMSGCTAFGDVAELLKMGSKAVRDVAAEYGRDIKVVVHYTQIDNPDGTLATAEKLSKYKVDYDVFGVSYYPYWHGSFANMKKVLSDISSNYGVETCIMETSYMYTSEDGDSSSNSLSAGDALEDYPIGIQGQASLVRDVMAASFEAGAIGTFYWEGAWIPVKPESGSSSAAWEEYGSGWASSYASEYDPKDAGVYYGGCSWDNQAFFDFDGHVLDSINVFKYVDFGAIGEQLEIIKIPEVELAFSPGSELVMPETIKAIYNDSACKDELPVVWNEEDLATIDMDATGTYQVKGQVNGDTSIVATVIVSNINLLSNPSFEDNTDTSMWVVNPISGDNPTDFQNKSSDAHDGNYSLHYWSQSDMEFTVEQTVEVGQAGTYSASVFMQGGDFNPEAQIILYVKVGVDETEYQSNPVKLDGWCNWKNPTITGIPVTDGDIVKVGAYVKCNALAWATMDEFSLTLE